MNLSLDTAEAVLLLLDIDLAVSWNVRFLELSEKLVRSRPLRQSLAPFASHFPSAVIGSMTFFRMSPLRLALLSATSFPGWNGIYWQIHGMIRLALTSIGEFMARLLMANAQYAKINVNR